MCVNVLDKSCVCVHERERESACMCGVVWCGVVCVCVCVCVREREREREREKQREKQTKMNLSGVAEFGEKHWHHSTNKGGVVSLVSGRAGHVIQRQNQILLGRQRSKCTGPCYIPTRMSGLE